MRFKQKLERLTEEKNRSQLARAAGLPTTLLSNYINRGSTPRADIALKIARALNVPLDWLIDDRQDWPPPDTEPRARRVQDIPFGDLIAELARRYRLDLIEAIQRAREAEVEDWDATAQELRALAPNQKPPAELRRKLMNLYELLNAMTLMIRYDVGVAADLLHDRLPGRDLPIATTNQAHFLDRINNLHKLPGFVEAIEGLSGPGVTASMVKSAGPVLPIRTLLELVDQRRRLEVLEQAAASQPAPPDDEPVRKREAAIKPKARDRGTRAQSRSSVNSPPRGKSYQQGEEHLTRARRAK